MHFAVVEPEGEETPVVVEVPHAGLGLDPEALAWLTAPARFIGHDADLYVDELFQDAPRHGATLLTAGLSRYVCDLNRSEQDLDERSAETGRGTRAPHGIVWRQTTEEHPALLRPLPHREVQRRLENIYNPYHRALDALLERKLKRFGKVVLLCAHSMPSRSRTPRVGVSRAQVVIGSQGRTTATRAYIDAPATLAERRGWSVAHDDPYAGGYTTRRHGRPSRHIHAVQLELSRALYMDEPSLAQRPVGFAETREYAGELVARLAQLASE
jgi:N-formylglutamate deformylase